MSHLDVKRLAPLEISVAKRIFKLKGKALNQFVRGFNAAVIKRPLTYYSQQIDQKFIFIFDNDGEYHGVVGNVSKTHKTRESLC